MKTYDIKPPGLTESIVNLKRFFAGKIFLSKKETLDLFREELLNRFKAHTVSFSKEDLFDEQFVFHKKTVLLNERIKLKTFSIGEFLEKLKPKPISYWGRPLFRFSSALFILSLFFPVCSYIEKGLQVKERVTAQAEEGYNHLLEAKEAAEKSDFKGAEKSFQSAASSFKEASSLTAEIGNIVFLVLKYMPVSNKVSSGAYLLESGEHISKAGELVLSGVSPFLENKPDIYFEEDDKNVFLTEEIKNSRGKIEDAQEELIKAEEALSKIKVTDLPKEVQGKTAELKNKLPVLVESSNTILKYFDAFLMILGDDQAKKYLFIFQNNREARATGGFIGTYGVIDVDRGRVEKIFVDGIYNPDGQMAEKIIPPKPIQKIDNTWHMRDSNWFCDFPLSANKISWFYEKTGGPTVDGIITMTPTVIEKLLILTGPIEMPEYGISVDSNNFVEKTQYEVEFGYDKEENQPKKFLADLTPQILDKVFSLPQDKWPALLSILGESLKEKHILLFFKDDEAEDFVLKYNFGGAVLDTKGDFLMIVNSNIGGHKTDFLMENKVYHHVRIENDGRVIDEVVIKRKHLGGTNEGLNLPEGENWYKKTNYNYLRVLVPSGAKLLDAGGFTDDFEIPDYTGDDDFINFKKDEDIVGLEGTLKEILDKKVWTGKEAGKTVFSGWVATPPQKESVITLKYELPFKISFEDFLEKTRSYSLLLEKQAGAPLAIFESTIELPEGVEVKWHYGDGVNLLDNKVIIKTSFNRDKYFGIVIAK